MMYPLREELEQGKRALLAFFVDGRYRYRASFPTAAMGHPLGGAGFLGAALGISFLQPTVYEASAKLLVGVGQEPDDFINQASLQLDTRAAADAIDQRHVAEEVIRRLDLPVSPEEFLEQLRVEQIPDTQFIDVSYVDPSPQRAQSTANAVALVASQESRQEASFVYDLRIYVYERASVPTTPVSPNPLRNSILALVLGLVVGIGLALLMERRAT